MEVHEVSEFITWNLPRPTFYIDAILAQEGSMLLYGGAGAMKSWLAEYMGFCIATGSEFLGMRTTQARVLLINFEISSVGYYWRLRNMSRHFTLPDALSFYESSPSTMTLEDRTVFNYFSEAIRPIAPKVIILDCLQSFFGGDENDTQQVSQLINHLVELKNEHQAAMVIVHHENKNNLATGSMVRSRGSTKLVGWVDTVARLVEQPGGRQLQFEKYRMSPYELRSINIQFNDYLWQIR